MNAADRIDHVVLIFKENHSFDNYFGGFPGADGAPGLPRAPDPPPYDPPHDHPDWLTRDRTAPRVSYSEHDIPAYWSYARQFTLCDRYFTDVAGPSTPNHLMLICADSPIIANPWSQPRPPQPPYDLRSLPKALEAAGHTWAHYGEGYAIDYIAELRGTPNAKEPSQFAVDAAAGRLPDVSWVYAPEGLDEHPKGCVARGSCWTADQVDAIVRGGLWDRCAIFISFDDFGGWWDHVDPPEVETWSDGTQFRYGSRVPCIALGPYAKRAHVSHSQYSHVSLTRFIETVFGVEPLTQRDAQADPMTDCFDFDQQPLAPPAPFRMTGRWAQPRAGAATTNLSGRLEVFARTASGAVVHNYQRGPGSAWTGRWPSLGGSAAGNVAVGQNADGRLEVFVRAPDATVSHRWQMSAGGAFSPAWRSLDGAAAGDPAVALNADGRLEVFVRTAGGAIAHRWQSAPGAQWEGRWGDLGGDAVSDPAIAANADGRLEIVIRNAGGHLEHAWQRSPGAQWSGWSRLGGTVLGAPALAMNLDGRLEAFALGTQDGVWHAWQESPGGTWSAGGSLGGNLVGSPIVGQNIDGRLEVFARGHDDAIWHAWQEEPGGAWSGWSSLGGGFTADPVIAGNLDGRLEVFAVGPDHTVHHNYQRTPAGQWSGWKSLGGDVVAL